jgi:hypothetical protein
VIVIWVAAVSVSTLAACGSRAGEAGDGDTNQPIARDIAALRTAASSGASDEAVHAVSVALSAARAVPNDREGWKGQALLGTRLPSIVDRFLRDYPRTRRRLVRVDTETATGAAIKAWLLRGYRRQRRDLLQLREELAGGGYAWGAVLRWEGAQSTAVAESDGELRSIVRALPAAQQVTADRALAQHG